MTESTPPSTAPADATPASTPSPFAEEVGDRPNPFGGIAHKIPKWAWPVGLVVLILLIFGTSLASSYNKMVDKDEAVKTAFSNVDIVLQRRLDLIPNLSASVKAALNQEQEVFGTIAEARTRYAGTSDPNEKVAASNQMESALARLLVIVEQYPQLRSNENIRDLMSQLEGTENRIAQERRNYNEVALDYNKFIRRFPRGTYAGMFGFERAKLFEASPGANVPPAVNLDTSPAPSAS